MLHAMDLDVPKNILRFSVVKAPQHGSIVNPGSEKPPGRRREAGARSPVVDFTMADLTNGHFTSVFSLPDIFKISPILY